MWFVRPFARLYSYAPSAVAEEQDLANLSFCATATARWEYQGVEWMMTFNRCYESTVIGKRSNVFLASSR